MKLGTNYLVNGKPAKFVAEHFKCADSVFMEFPSGKARKINREQVGDELIAQYVGCGLVDGIIVLTDAKSNSKHAQNSWNKHFSGQFLYVIQIDVLDVVRLNSAS
jgi:hypothetical protein